MYSATNEKHYTKKKICKYAGIFSGSKILGIFYPSILISKIIPNLCENNVTKVKMCTYS